MAAKTLRFPQQVKTRSLGYEQAKGLFSSPRQLLLTVSEPQLHRRKIVLSALLQNRASQPFSLVVNPYGGSFPYGGDSPFRLAFSPEAGKVIKYSGELFSPEPPSPMLIQIPAFGCVQFDAHIDLSNYSYSGSPRVTLDWAFHYFEGKHPQGRVKVQLPRR